MANNDEHGEYKFHPITALWPKLTKAEFNELVESIKTHGLRNPIVLHPDDDTIVDGRHRYKGCLAAGVEPKFVYWDGAGSLLDFVIDQNNLRRHLTPDQWATVALDVKDYIAAEIKATKGGRISEGMNATKDAGPSDTRRNLAEDRSKRASNQAAKVFPVSPDRIDRTAAVRRAEPEAIQKIKEGEETLRGAEKRLGVGRGAAPKKPYTVPFPPGKVAPSVSNGKCRLPDGTVVPDTPEAAKERLKLKLPEHVIFDFDKGTPGPSIEDIARDKEEERAIREEQETDETWVASLPLAKKLTDRQLAIFVADALNWRHLQVEQRRFGKAVAERLNKTKSSRIGPWLKRAKSFVAAKSPDQWVLCPPPTVGEGSGCAGAGMLTTLSNKTMLCPRCHGCGYWLGS
jgi:hypothetical protein